MTFEEGPAARRTVLGSLLNPQLGNVVNRQVREKKTHREEEAGRAETKKHRENNRGQAMNESNSEWKQRKGETPETGMKKKGRWKIRWQTEIDSVVQTLGGLRVSAPSCEPHGLLAKHPTRPVGSCASPSLVF